MHINNCQNCKNDFNPCEIFNGKRNNTPNRKFCYICSPYGSHNTRKSLESVVPSYIDSLTFEEFSSIIKKSVSRTDFFKKINMRSSGGSFKILNRRIERDNIDISHFKTAYELRISKGEISYDVILTEKSEYASTNSLKKRLIKDGILKYLCSICLNIGEHNKKPLILQLDHINGIRNDNRIENLRLLCPNCHSQTETFCGKQKKKKLFSCEECGQNKKYKKSRVCQLCNSKNPRGKKIFISDEELKIKVMTIPISHLSKELKVSDSALLKYCKKHNINLPPRGFWIRKQA